MKKFLMVLLATACAVCAFAALDVNTTKTIPVLAPQSISSGATNTVVFQVGGLKGVDALVVCANPCYGRTLDVTLYATNFAEGGWSVYSHGVFANTNNCVVRLPFQGQYLPKDVKVSVGSLGGASTATAYIEAY